MMRRLSGRIEAIIFDLDDTLVPSTDIYHAVYQRFGLLGDPVFHRARQVVKDRLGAESPASHQRLLYFKACEEMRAQRLTKHVTPAAVLKKQHQYEHAVFRAVAYQWRLLRRANWLQRLRQHVKIAVCTNETTRMQLIKWQAMDLPRGWCDAFVTSEEMGREKPAVVMFQEVAARLRLPLSRCLMVGDDLKRDIAPAQALGMPAAWTSEFLSRSRLVAQLSQHRSVAAAALHIRKLSALHWR